MTEVRRDWDKPGYDAEYPRLTRIIYISGPMTGIPKYNFPAFNRAAQCFRMRGFDVVNPAEFDNPKKIVWSTCLRRDIKALMDCNWIALLPRWENSKGATLEKYIAEELGMGVLFIDENGNLI